MLKKFEEFLSNNKVDESNDNKVVVKYRWFDYFKQQYFETKCEIISQTDKTAKIKLLEFGPNGARPGTIMTRVHLKSLKRFDEEKPKGEVDTTCWRKYTDPDLFKEDRYGDEDVNESKNSVGKGSEAKNLVGIAKKYFEDGDLENAGKIWCEIYDLYDDMYNEDTHNEEERMKLFTEFQEIMRFFTDDEVYGITDYLKNKYYKR